MVPFWWHWELAFTDHILDRMEDRGFTEVELRAMLERDPELSHDVVPGRWLIRTHFRNRPWEVIVEPLHDERILLVITAYRVSGEEEDA